MKINKGSCSVELKLDKLKDLIKDIYQENRGLKVGILENATNISNSKTSVAEYAYYNEFGTKNIPARPFMRTTLKNKSDYWADVFLNEIRGKSTEKGIISKALKQVGLKAEANIRETIEAGGFEPNNELTLKIKGDHKVPLKDTGAMFNAISSEVTTSRGGRL